MKKIFCLLVVTMFVFIGCMMTYEYFGGSGYYAYESYAQTELSEEEATYEETYTPTPTPSPEPEPTEPPLREADIPADELTEAHEYEASPVSTPSPEQEQISEQITEQEALHFLTIISGEGGRIVVGESGYYAANYEIMLEAETDENYMFLRWESDGGSFMVGEYTPFNLFTMPDNAATITATFVYMCDTDTTGSGIPDWLELIFELNFPDVDINNPFEWFPMQDRHMMELHEIPDAPPSYQILSERNIARELLSDDNWLIPSISGTVSGSIDRHVELRESRERIAYGNRALQSRVMEVITSYDAPLTLTLTANPSFDVFFGDVRSLFVMHWDGELHPLETTANETAGTLTATIPGAGVYLVMDLDAFLQSLGIDVFGSLAP